MNRLLIAGAACALAVPGVAGAATKPDKTKPSYCVPKKVGYAASGTFVSGDVKKTAGANTAKRSDDRYSGEIVVNVKKANHKGLKGEQTITLTNTRVKFHPRNDTVVAAGDRVKLSGRITRLGKKCDTTGFEPTVTARKVDIKAKRA